jgi:hypothetical protein
MSAVQEQRLLAAANMALALHMLQRTSHSSSSVCAIDASVVTCRLQCVK